MSFDRVGNRIELIRGGLWHTFCLRCLGKTGVVSVNGLPFLCIIKQFTHSNAVSLFTGCISWYFWHGQGRRLKGRCNFMRSGYVRWNEYTYNYRRSILCPVANVSLNLVIIAPIFNRVVFNSLIHCTKSNKCGRHGFTSS